MSGSQLPCIAWIGGDHACLALPVCSGWLVCIVLDAMLLRCALLASCGLTGSHQRIPVITSHSRPPGNPLLAFAGQHE